MKVRLRVVFIDILHLNLQTCYLRLYLMANDHSASYNIYFVRSSTQIPTSRLLYMFTALPNSP